MEKASRTASTEALSSTKASLSLRYSVSLCSPYAKPFLVAYTIATNSSAVAETSARSGTAQTMYR